MFKGWFDYNSPQNVWGREHQKEVLAGTAVALATFVLSGGIFLYRMGRVSNQS